MQIKYICLIFGIVPSTASGIINKMIKLVCKKLKRHDAAKIKFPNEEEKIQFAQLVQNREPTVDNIIGFVDGLAIPIQCFSDEDEQAYIEWAGLFLIISYIDFH